MEFSHPGRRGFTVPMLATLPSARSRACRSGVRSGSATPDRSSPLGLRARTRWRVSAMTAARSSLFGTTVPAPGRGYFGVDAAEPREFAHHGRRNRTACVHHILEKAVYGIFLKDSEIAVGQHVHLERLQLEAQLVGDVVERDFAMIRQAGFRADRSELGHDDLNFVTGILVRPSLDFGQACVDTSASVCIRVLAFHWAGIKVLASRSRKRPTSVTTPTAWPVPRSLTLVATAGLMSTHTIFTQLGSMLPTAIECSMEPRQSTRPAPFSSSAYASCA